MIKILPIKNWIEGWINKIEDRSIPRGSFSDGLNWLLQGDKVELRRGSRMLGTAEGNGTVNGIHTTYAPNGDEILVKKNGAGVYYSTDGGDNWTEIGTLILQSSAVNDDITFANYSSLAGTQLWFSTPNSGLYKIMTANMDSYGVMSDADNNYGKGYIKIIKNRLWQWGYPKSPSTIYLSYIDNQKYTTVSAEVVDTGDGGKNYSGTLAFKSGTKRTCFAIQIQNVSGTVETFTDNRDGTLTGSSGGTGTINYTTWSLASEYCISLILASAELLSSIK